MVGDDTQGTRRFMQRAIRRLNALEYALLAGAALLALAGGFLAALFLREELGFPLRLTWAVCTVLLFVLPGAAVLGREKLKGREPPEPRDGE